MKKKTSATMSRFALALGGVGGLLVALWVFAPSGTTVHAETQIILETCAAESSREACYEREVPERYGDFDVPELFEVVRAILREDRNYQFCHVLAHKIGERAVAEDRDAWLSLVPKNPADGLCSNGYIHGVIVGRFRDDAFDDALLKATLPDFARACEPQTDWSPSPLDQAICYHGMGHLFMFITDADYRRSLDSCEVVGDSVSGDFRRVCREGVFMQTYQPLEPDDFLLLELLPEIPNADNYRRICAKFPDDGEEAACLREAWPLFREGIIDGTGIGAFCSGHPRGHEDACYDTVFAIIGRMSQGEQHRDRIASSCSGAPREWQGYCFGTVAYAFIEENRTAVDEAVGVCARAPDYAQDGCYEVLVTRRNFAFGSNTDGIARLCAALPSSWRAQCEY